MTRRVKAQRTGLLGIPVKVPRIGTPSSKQYFGSFLKIHGFLSWVCFMATRIDDVSSVAGATLEGMHKRFPDLIPAPERGPGKRMIEVLGENRQFFLELILARHVENYLNYLSSLLYEVFLARPETLKSSEAIEIAEVLRHESRKDLVRALANRKVDRLAYESFEDLRDFFQQKLGLTLLTHEAERIVVEAIETRNISVHNRCVINRRYIKRTGASEGLEGKTKELGAETLEALLPVLNESVMALDAQARKRLRLRAVRFNLTKKGSAQQSDPADSASPRR